MNKGLLKAEILRQIKRLADEDGSPPGRARFQNATGIKYHEWRGLIWRTWSDALEEAGFTPKSFTGPIAADVVLTAVIELARQLKRFPNSSDLLFESSNNPEFPSAKTIMQRWKMTELADAVRALSENLGDSETIAYSVGYLASARSKESVEKDETASNESIGYVYMIRYGKDFKIGRTSSLTRRSRQVQIELPESTDLIHSILTDDPAGIEAYWHRRFASYRGSGEWFRLPKHEVAAFKKWAKIL
ncbi:MAG: GIY-YIG nuclease family protein [Mesorhizobium sp.]|uniref:GIY-YIG nuclease family protein n=1 Tax=Mesorhizobium sp. TaxID=1871066 RepID=UPI000FE9F042|nr:GIY-YIG nuclease family protein [Mesorhizobium sp.]RWB72944.1 MAG: GIY-YIG nuclease family protein [Mesorhizobium sp.]